MVIVEVEGKPEMPNVVWIPKEQTSAMIPMPKKADLKYELFADDDVPTVEQLEAQRAEARAQWESIEATKKLIEADIAATKAKEATKAKLPDETVSSSKLDTLSAEMDTQELVVEAEIPIIAPMPKEIKLKYAKAKPKKRGRKPGSKNKKKD